ncbi:hypothetical protein ACHAWU_005054 [Discostella pseudostelligera]|uniref:PPIase cyclophilin-type domain-containing protein n=1 Tax=Discostella pseudostelligera TaxID=259834 RepID=A0ABD3M6R4_9STRA
MASAGSPIMGGGGIGPSNNNTYRRTLPGYGNHPNPSSGPTSSSSSFTERLTGISSPSMKSPRQLHLQQQQQHYARVRRMKLFIGGLALLASVYCLVLKLRGGSEWDTTMDQYRATMQRMIPAQEMMMASWKALISSGKGNDDAASSVDGDEEGDDNHSHYHHDQQNHHHHHHQQQQQQQDAIVDPLKQVLEQLQHQKQQMESEIQLLREKYHKMNSEVQLQQEQLNGVQLKIKEEEIKLIEYHKENSNNEKDRIVREKQLVLQQQEQQQREDALRDRIKLLSDNLGKESRRAVLESFGPGPHVVELFLEFPQYHPNVELDSWPRVRGKLTLEMAPLDLMPVSVNLFLQQIHHKLWNGCAFVINAEHILQAGPHLPSSDGKEYTLKSPEILNRFRESGLMELPFQEYQEEYPHEQYTIGYAGRPGGLNWYINKVNNTLNHGPGGQRHYNSMIDEADPCFAKVVSGWDVLEYIEKLPVENARLVRPLVIADSRVIISRTSEQQQPQQQ